MKNLEKVAQDLQELRRMREELDAEIAAAEDAIKAAMGEDEEMTLGAVKFTWKPVTSTRIDTAALRKDLPEIWQEYGKSSTVRRFCIC